MGCDARALLSATNTGRLTRAYETPVGRCRKVYQQYLADQKHLLASDEALVGLPWQALTDRGHSKVPFCIHSATYVAGDETLSSDHLWIIIQPK